MYICTWYVCVYVQYVQYVQYVLDHIHLGGPLHSLHVYLSGVEPGNIRDTGLLMTYLGGLARLAGLAGLG
jgi:hypothetical protein